MAVMRRRLKRRRLQISLLQEDYELAKKLAEERGTSMARVFVSGLHREDKEMRRWQDPLRDLIGMVKDGPTDGSIRHDEMIYG